MALFPEGISHDETTLQPLKTGAARIALQALDKGGADDLVTVAVGLVYDAKARFRSRALVRVGEPVAVAQWVEDYRRNEWSTVQSVTAALEEQLSRVNPSFASWTQAKQLSWIAEVLVRAPGGPGQAEVTLADKIEVAARLAARQVELPAVLEDLCGAFALYERDLNLLGVNDAQLVARLPAAAPAGAPAVRAHTPGRVAFRRRRSAGASRPLPHHEAGGEAAGERADQAHRSVPGLATSLRPYRLRHP